MRPIQTLVRQRPRINPLHKVFKILRILARQGQTARLRLSKIVARIESCREKGGDGDEGFEVEGEWRGGGTDVYGYGGFEEMAGWEGLVGW